MRSPAPASSHLRRGGIFISKLMKLSSLVVAALLAWCAFGQEPEYGPARGTLVIQGGGSDEGTGIFETFMNKAGGLGA